MKLQTGIGLLRIAFYELFSSVATDQWNKTGMFNDTANGESTRNCKILTALITFDLKLNWWYVGSLLLLAKEKSDIFGRFCTLRETWGGGSKYGNTATK